MSSSRTRKRERAAILALAASLLIHLVAGPLLVKFLAWTRQIVVLHGSLQEPPPPREIDRIALERAPKPTPAPTAPPVRHIVPRVVVRRPPPVAPPPSRHEIAHTVVHAPAQPPPQPPAVARVTLPQRTAPAPPHRPTSAVLSEQRLAEFDAAFAKTIAASHQTLADVQTASEHTPVQTVKHYTMAFNGFHAGMQPGDGTIVAISHQRIGDTMWYYTRYTYIHADGTYESDTIPWPFHYPIDDDPFARHDARIPIQPPPDGYKPDRPLKPILEQFFGGPRVTD